MKGYAKGKLPQVIFGSNTAEQIGTQLKNCEIKRCLIVSDPRMIGHNITKRVIQVLKDVNIDCRIYDQVQAEPSDTICLKIAEIIKTQNCDCVLAIGGGSPMDAAKAAALIAGIPEKIEDLHEYGKSGTRMREIWKRPCMLALMPTTAGTGAETTSSAVISSTVHQLKFSFGNRNTSADLCIIDPAFTIGMPAGPTANGGADAIAHAVENLLGTGANEYTNTVLIECFKRAWKWLPIAMKESENLEAREQLAWAAHNALANGGMPNGHAVAHAIGSLYHLVHGHACMVVLPTVIRHFAESAQDVIAEIAKIIDVPVTGDAKTDADRVADAFMEFYKNLGMKPFKAAMLEKGFQDDEQTFCEKMIPVILDDFKSKEWMPPIHTGDYQTKIAKICAMIYEEQ